MISPPHVLASSYNYRLVVLSVFIAILAAYAALDLAERVTSAHGAARALWLAGGAVAMGTGIWSMHYIGMLAFRLPIPVRYDWPTVVVSLLAAIFASAVALFVVSQKRMGYFPALAGSIVMGCGIAAMHYIGMAAMRLEATCAYSIALVTLSVVLAIAISLVALWLTFYSRHDITSWGWRKIVSALVMGAAIPVMHYTGMAAASFTPSALPEDMSHAVSISALGTAGISVVTLLVLGLAFITSLVDRRFAAQALELESSEYRYRQIVETAFDAFVGMDSRGLITDWNPQAEATFGWPRHEALGKSFAQLAIPRGNREASERELARFLASGEGVRLHKWVEMTALHRDGHEFPVDLTISTIRSGGTRGFAAFVRDITERKRAENELARQAEELKRSNAELEQFAYVASHDLQEPLRMVSSYTQLLGKRYKGRLDSSADEFIHYAVDGVTRMQRLIQDLLAYSRVGTKQKAMREIPGQSVFERAMANLGAAIKTGGAIVTADPLPAVVGDESQLVQVFQNLVGNAVKYRGSETPRIHISAQRNASHRNGGQEERDEPEEWLFSVRDNGIGIAPEYFDRIFLLFQRLHGRGEYDGNGLGLSITKKIVERHGGRIWVESEPGKGSCFYFTLRGKQTECSQPTLKTLQQ